MTILDNIRNFFTKQPPAVQPAPETKVERSDGWANFVTGIGTQRDKSQSTNFFTNGRIPDATLQWLYNEDDICATIVNLRIEELFRRGYKVTCDSEDVSELKTKADELGLSRKLRESAIWARLFGGCLLVLGFDDGQTPDKPLNEKRIRDIKYATVIDRRYAQAMVYDYDTMSPNYGEPLMYSVGFAQKVQVHASRVIRFDGQEVDRLTRLNLGGWSYSVLQRPYEAIRQFANVYAAVGTLVMDASQGVYKIENLISLLASNSNQVIQRLQAIDTTRSVVKGIVLDSKEDFTRVPTVFTGLPEVITIFMQRLAAATRIPVTLLMGMSPAGLNATGESDIRTFYDSVTHDQPDMVERMYKVYRPLAEICGLDPEKIKISFPPLWEETDKERADRDWMIAQRDVAYVQAGIWLPEEVALARSKGLFGIDETEIDETYREKAAEQTINFELDNPQGNPESPGSVDIGGNVPGGQPILPKSMSNVLAPEDIQPKQGPA